MSLVVRRATMDDLPAMVAVREALRFGANRRGGFLLGTDRAGLEALIGAAQVLVLCGPEVGGMAVTLGDAAVRASSLWARRAQVAWRGFDPTRLEHGRVAYFDQLAVLPHLQGTGAAALLASTAVRQLLEAGTTDLFATTVRVPVENPAAWRLLERIGARRVGLIAEQHPDIGALVSDLFHAAADDIAMGLLRWQRRGAHDPQKE